METVEKHVDVLTSEDLELLLKHAESPCISVYLPTVRQAPDARQNLVRFQNSVNEVRAQLEASGQDRAQIDELLAPLEPLLRDPPDDFWRFVSEGLAVFLAPGVYRTYRLPMVFDDFSYIGENFHIRRLLPLITIDEEYYVLTLSQDNAQLFRGDQYVLTEVNLADVPQSLAEVLQYDQFERQLQLHTLGDRGPQADSGGTIYHGHGSAGDDTAKTDNILRFFRALDNGVYDYLDNKLKPLIIAGVAQLRGLYRQVNHYNHLLAEDIDTHPRDLDIEALYNHAWTIIYPRTRLVVLDALETYHELSGNLPARVTTDLELIVSGAYFQRVDTLFLTEDASHAHYGVFDAENNRVTFYRDFKPGGHDLLNHAAISTLNNGGKVYCLEPGEVPGGVSGVAAILRF